jgi:hypothetical protein
VMPGLDPGIPPLRMDGLPGQAPLMTCIIH